MHAVVFTGGEFSPPEMTDKFWNKVGGPDFVVAADSGLCAAEKYALYFSEKYDFKPDLILGDMDSLDNPEEILKKYSPEIIEKHNPYKDFTDTELALDYVKNHINGDGLFITLVGGAGGRVDHLLGIFDIFSMPIRPSVWLYNNQALWYAAAGDEFEIFSLTMKDYVSVARINGCRSGGKILSEGLEWESPLFRKEGMPSISNRISTNALEKNQPLKLSVSEGSFVLILPLEAEVLKKSKVATFL